MNFINSMNPFVAYHEYRERNKQAQEKENIMLSWCTSAASKQFRCSGEEQFTNIREALEICDSYKFKTSSRYNPYYMIRISNNKN